MFNPFSAGLLAMAGAANPAAFSQAIGATGVSPGDASMMMNNNSGYALGSGFNLGQFLNPAQQPGIVNGWGATVTPAPGMDMSQSGLDPRFLNKVEELRQQAQNGLVKGPEQQKPIMSGGVSNAQQAPQAQVGGLTMNPLMQALTQLIQGGASSRPINLGTLLQGV